MRGGRVTASLRAQDVSTERLVALVTGAEEEGEEEGEED
jgi:hypothetical protein